MKSTVPKNMLSNDGLATFIRVAIDAEAPPGCLGTISCVPSTLATREWML
jgi:hypothetical protein